MLASLLFALIVATALLALGWRRYRHARRQLALTRLLDLADEVESLLDRSQERMAAMQPVVGRVPADIAAVARAALDSNLPIREAKRDVLQHRLWIQQHGQSASPAELEAARAALERVQQRLDSQLRALDQAGAELADATRAAEEAARREPATLRRPTEG